MANGGGRGLNCFTCSKNISRYEDSLRCCECSSYFHISCGGVDLESFVDMNINKTAKEWRCRVCIDITSTGGIPADINSVLANDRENSDVSGRQSKSTSDVSDFQPSVVLDPKENVYLQQEQDEITHNNCFVDVDKANKLDVIMRNQEIIIKRLQEGCKCSEQIFELKRENSELKTYLQQQVNYIIQLLKDNSKYGTTAEFGGNRNLPHSINSQFPERLVSDLPSDKGICDKINNAVDFNLHPLIVSTSRTSQTAAPSSSTRIKHEKSNVNKGENKNKNSVQEKSSGDVEVIDIVTNNAIPEKYFSSAADTDNAITLSQMSDAIASAKRVSADLHSGQSLDVQSGDPCNSNSDSKWIQVTSKRRSPRNADDKVGTAPGKKNDKPIRGMSEKQSVLKSAPKISFLHVSRLDPATKPDDVYAFSSQICKILQCEQLTSKYPQTYSSFKLIVPHENLELLLNANVWPKGVIVQKFFHRSPPRQKSM